MTNDDEQNDEERSADFTAFTAKRYYPRSGPAVSNEHSFSGLGLECKGPAEKFPGKARDTRRDSQKREQERT